MQTSSDGVVVAHFPRALQTRLQPGQAVQLQFVGAAPGDTLPATVADVAARPGGDQIEVIIYADMDAANAVVLQNGLTGQATVAVEQTSPARLVLRATGYGVDTPPVALDGAQ